MPKTYKKEVLEERYKLLEQYAELANQSIQHITSTAYRKVSLISNPVLSRNPHSSRFFKRLLFDENPARLNYWSVLSGVARYYVTSISLFVIYMLTFFA